MRSLMQVRLEGVLREINTLQKNVWVHSSQFPIGCTCQQHKVPKSFAALITSVLIRERLFEKKGVGRSTEYKVLKDFATSISDLIPLIEKENEIIKKAVTDKALTMNEKDIAKAHPKTVFFEKNKLKKNNTQYVARKTPELGDVYYMIIDNRIAEVKVVGKFLDSENENIQLFNVRVPSGLAESGVVYSKKLNELFENFEQLFTFLEKHLNRL